MNKPPRRELNAIAVSTPRARAATSSPPVSAESDALKHAPPSESCDALELLNLLRLATSDAQIASQLEVTAWILSRRISAIQERRMADSSRFQLITQAVTTGWRPLGDLVTTGRDAAWA